MKDPFTQVTKDSEDWVDKVKSPIYLVGIVIGLPIGFMIAVIMHLLSQ